MFYVNITKSNSQSMEDQTYPHSGKIMVSEQIRLSPGHVVAMQSPASTS